MAGRLGHRRSTDIDVFVPDLSDTIAAQRGGRHDLARATGGERVVENDLEAKVRVAGGEIDLMAVKPYFEGSEETVEIDGHPETVLTNAQILRGKLDRTNRPVTRDAFDFVTAAKLDHRALEIAVNAMGKKETRNICAQIQGHGPSYARDLRTRKVLTGVPRELHVNPDELGEQAAQALESHRYRGMTVELKPDRIEITTERKGREPRTEAYPRGKAEAGLVESGALDHLATNWRISRDELRSTVREALDRGWSGTLIDSEWTEPQTALERSRNEIAELDEVQRRRPGTKGPNEPDHDSGGNELAPPSAEMQAGHPIDHSSDVDVTRAEGEPVGGTPTTRREVGPDNTPGDPGRGPR